MGIFSFFKKKKSEVNKISPESKWIVQIVGTTIKTVDYDGIEKSFEIYGIQQIIIETNDSGPWGTDLWWRIFGKDGLLSVPGGATGESEMLENFQRFPNFDNAELIKSMSSTDNAEFVVWQNK